MVTLIAMLDENWRQYAECQYGDRLPADAMYPDYDDRAAVREAKQVCHDCPVRAECLNFAITTSEDHGVWGGTTPIERRMLGMMPRVVEVADWVADIRRAMPDTDCGTPGGVSRHRREATLYDCDVCLVVKRDQDRESKRRQRARARQNGAA